MTPKISKRDQLRMDRLNAVSDDQLPAETEQVKNVSKLARDSHIGGAISQLSGGMYGQLVEAQKELSDARAEVARLRELQERAETDPEGAGVKEFDPALVAATRFVNRSARAFDVERNPAFADLVEDVKAKGHNVVPGLVRPLPSPADDGALYECVYGHRRRKACEINGAPFRAWIADVSDREAMLLQQAENLHHEALSPIERGRQVRSYLTYLRSESGKLQQGAREQLAVDLKAKPQMISRLVAIGDIPDELVDLFPDEREVGFKDALEMGVLSRNSPDIVRDRMRLVPEGAGMRQIVNLILGRDQPSKMAPPARPKVDALLRKLESKVDAAERKQLDQAVSLIRQLAAKHKLVKGETAE